MAGLAGLLVRRREDPASIGAQSSSADSMLGVEWISTGDGAAHRSRRHFHSSWYQRSIRINQSGNELSARPTLTKSTASTPPAAAMIAAVALSAANVAD